MENIPCLILHFTHLFVSLPPQKMQMRIGNKFVELAIESPLTSLDRAVNLAWTSLAAARPRSLATIGTQESRADSRCLENSDREPVL